MKARNIYKKFFAGSLVAVAGASQAAIDVASVTTAIGDAGTAAGTVGAAVLVMIVGIKVYKWIRASL